MRRSSSYLSKDSRCHVSLRSEWRSEYRGTNAERESAMRTVLEAVSVRVGKLWMSTTPWLWLELWCPELHLGSRSPGMPSLWLAVVKRVGPVHEHESFEDRGHVLFIFIIVSLSSPYTLLIQCLELTRYTKYVYWSEWKSADFIYIKILYGMWKDTHVHNDDILRKAKR